MAESSKNSNHCLYQPKWFYKAFTPAKVVLYQSIQSSYLIWRAFWRTSSDFPAFCLKFEVWVSCEAVWEIFDQFCFSVWFFKMEFNPMPDLLNTRFTIVEIGLFFDGEHLGAKIRRFLTCFDKITSRWRFNTYFIIGDGDVWKHFKYWLCFSNVFLKRWTYFPKDMINSKTRCLLHFFYELISAFDKFQW